MMSNLMYFNPNNPLAIFPNFAETQTKPVYDVLQWMPLEKTTLNQQDRCSDEEVDTDRGRFLGEFHQT